MTSGNRTKARRKHLEGISHAGLVAARKDKYGPVLPAPEFKGHAEERRSANHTESPSKVVWDDAAVDRLIADVLPNRVVEHIGGSTSGELAVLAVQRRVGDPRNVITAQQAAASQQILHVNFENTSEQIKARYDAISEMVEDIDDEEDETAAILADPEAVAAIDEGLADLDTGQVEDLDEVEKRILVDGGGGYDDDFLSDDLNAPGVGIKELRQEAKNYKIKGAWTMKSDTLRAAIREARRRG